MKKFSLAIAVVLLAVTPAFAQWQTPNHSVPIGKGGGIQGFGNVPPGTAGQPFVSTGPTTDPVFGPIANSGFAAGSANTYKGSLNGTTVVDVPIPDCEAASTAIRYVAGSGPVCGNIVVQTGFDMPVNMGLSSSAVGGALTINVTTASGGTPSASTPVLVPFRSLTASSGAVAWGTISSALSLAIPSGATLGTSNGVPFRVWLFLDANGGTPAIGVATCNSASSIFACSSWEYTLKTSSAISAGATSPGVLYATVGVTLDAVRIIGYCDFPSGLVTAGTWASACATLQVFGPGIKKPGDTVQATSVNGNTSLNITPSSSINRIKFTASYNCSAIANPAPALINFVRGSTNLLTQSLGASAASAMTLVAGAAILDVPSTSSLVSYSITNTGQPCGSGNGVMLLEEIMG